MRVKKCSVDLFAFQDNRTFKNILRILKINRFSSSVIFFLIYFVVVLVVCLWVEKRRFFLHPVEIIYPRPVVGSCRTAELQEIHFETTARKLRRIGSNKFLSCYVFLYSRSTNSQLNLTFTICFIFHYSTLFIKYSFCLTIITCSFHRISLQ